MWRFSYFPPPGGQRGPCSHLELLASMFRTSLVRYLLSRQNNTHSITDWFVCFKINLFLNNNPFSLFICCPFLCLFPFLLLFLFLSVDLVILYWGGRLLCICIKIVIIQDHVWKWYKSDLRKSDLDQNQSLFTWLVTVARRSENKALFFSPHCDIHFCTVIKSQCAVCVSPLLYPAVQSRQPWEVRLLINMTMCVSFDVEDDQKIAISESKHAPPVLPYPSAPVSTSHTVHRFISRFSSQPAQILTPVFNFSDGPGCNSPKDRLSFYWTTGVLFAIIKCIRLFGWNKGWLVYFHICGHRPQVESVDVNCHRLI